MPEGVSYVQISVVYIRNIIPDGMAVPSPASLALSGRGLTFLLESQPSLQKGIDLDVLAEIARGALQILPTIVPNMLAVLVAALLSVVAVSFFQGQTTLFKTHSQLIIFIGGTLSPILAIAGGIAIAYRAHRRADFDQRELAVLFTLVFFAIAYYFELIGLPQITLGS
jgi:hypothetical protein